MPSLCFLHSTGPEQMQSVDEYDATMRRCRDITGEILRKAGRDDINSQSFWWFMAWFPSVEADLQGCGPEGKDTAQCTRCFSWKRSSRAQDVVSIKRRGYRIHEMIVCFSQILLIFPELIIQPCGISQTLNGCVGVFTYIYPFKVPKCSQKRTYIH